MKSALRHLMIFDFSGTLSLGAVEFGRSENLVPALAASGLSALGVSTETYFWNEIVSPTWVEGSTTGRGYKAVLVDRMLSLGLHAPGDPEPHGSIEKAVSTLLDRYFDQCRIEPHWRGLLESLNTEQTVQVLIATDHYAEATPLIQMRLRDWAIDAIALAEASPGIKNPFVIANSSDIGYHKADQRYWRHIHDGLYPASHGRVLLLDDFGANEDNSDPYGDPARVARRRQETEQVLRDVFPGEVAIQAFIVDRSGINPYPGRDNEDVYGMYIAKAISGVRSFLRTGGSS